MTRKKNLIVLEKLQKDPAGELKVMLADLEGRAAGSRPRWREAGALEPPLRGVRQELVQVCTANSTVVRAVDPSTPHRRRERER